MNDTTLARTFRHFRAGLRRPAHVALRLARESIAAGKPRYGSGIGFTHFGAWQDVDGKRIGSGRFRAFYVDSNPWRDVGDAHDIVRRLPLGWYSDAHQSETCIAIVAQMPARDGVAQYVPGYRWSDADGVTLFPLDRFEEKEEAARRADHYAEKAAEEAREYSEAWNAGREARDAQDEAEAARKDALALLREMKAARRAGMEPGGAICATLRGKVESLLETIREAREKRDDLRDGWTQRWRGDDIAGAFAEGFGVSLAGLRRA